MWVLSFAGLTASLDMRRKRTDSIGILIHEICECTAIDSTPKVDPDAQASDVVQRMHFESDVLINEFGNVPDANDVLEGLLADSRTRTHCATS
jgi:hypothetical protein